MAAVRDWRRRKPVVREHHHTETRAETVPQEILDRVASLERRQMDTERALQLILQTVHDSLGRVNGIESAVCTIANEAEQLYKRQAG